MQSILALVIVSVGIALFLLVPFDELADRFVDRTTTDPTDGEPSQLSSSEDTPFSDLQIERDQSAAKEILNQFTELQDEFEKNEYATRSFQSEYQRILERAAAGDQIYGVDPTQAEDIYVSALEWLQNLHATINEEFERAIGTGLSELANRNEDDARAAFERAQNLKPLAPQVVEGFTRVDALPRVNELIRESERARIRGDLGAALGYLDEIQSIDPQTSDLHAKRQIIVQAQAEKQQENLLTEAHAALAAKEFELADSRFREALLRDPGSFAALNGIEQTRRTRNRDRIDQLRIKADQEEDVLDLDKALKTYEAILEIDPTIEFAVDGRQRVYEIVIATRNMRITLNDPDRLSDPDDFATARQILQTAERHFGHSKDFDQMLTKFRNLVQYASQYVSVMLVSDNITEVVIIKEGPLGTFEQQQVELRPGRYVIMGSRDGFIDIRTTIVVEPGMSPVTIACVERI